MSDYPILRGELERALAFDQRRAMAGWAGRTDRYSVRSYLGAPAVKRNGALSDESRPGLLSRLACHFGHHRWATMTTGRAGFVHFQRCGRGCGTPRIVKGRS
jgi:hypothetical protein